MQHQLTTKQRQQLARRVRRLRLKNGMSIEEVCDRGWHIEPYMVEEYERGVRLIADFLELRHLARGLRTDAQGLYELAGWVNPCAVLV